MAEAGETVTQTGGANTNELNGGAEWYAPIREVLAKEEPETWTHFENGLKAGQYKDLPSLAKTTVNAQRKLGSVLVPPGKDAKPEEIKAFNDKLTNMGFRQPVPESPDKYELKLDSIPEDMRDQEFIGNFRKLAHEEGIPQKAVDRLVEAYGQQFGKSMQLFKDSASKAESRLREKVKAEGRTYEEAMAVGERVMTHFMQEAPHELQIFNQVYGNHPSVLWMFSKMEGITGEDSSHLGDGPANEEAMAEVDTKIATLRANKDNLPNEEIGRQLEPLYKQKALLMKRGKA